MSRKRRSLVERKHMSGKRKALIWVAVAAIVCVAGMFAYRQIKENRRPPIQPVTLTGAVLLQDEDPRKQAPIADATITATGGVSAASIKSDSSGFFRLELQPGI